MGTFDAHSGAFANTVLVELKTDSIEVPKNIRKGSAFIVDGMMSKDNFFYANATDWCVILIDPISIDLDGF